MRLLVSPFIFSRKITAANVQYQMDYSARCYKNRAFLQHAVQFQIMFDSMKYRTVQKIAKSKPDQKAKTLSSHVYAILTHHFIHEHNDKNVAASMLLHNEFQDLIWFALLFNGNRKARPFRKKSL